MKILRLLFVTAVFVVGGLATVSAQSLLPVTVSACGTPPTTRTAGIPYAMTMDTNGNLCSSAAGGGTTTVVGNISNASSAVATSSTNIPSVSYIYGFNGTTWDQLQVDGSKQLKVVIPANQSVNLAQVAGVSTPVGSGLQSTAPRVTLATDSPGITTLGPAVPASSLPVVSAGFTYSHITTDATTTLKSAAGVLHTICVNTLAATSTITVDDALSATTPTIAVVSGATAQCYTYDVAFSVGLTIVTAVATPDVTVSWR